MNPAFSVIFLTTLTGVGQGLFIALYAIERRHQRGEIPSQVQVATATQLDPMMVSKILRLL